jgi:dCTP deaminase
MVGEVLCDTEIRDLYYRGFLPGANEELISVSSLDNIICGEVWRLRYNTPLLNGQSVRNMLEATGAHRINTGTELATEPGIVYAIRLATRLDLSKEYYGEGHNRSRMGRLGLAVNLLSDGTPELNRIPAGYHGDVWALVCSTVFPLIIHPEKTIIPQIRFHKNGPPNPLKGKRLKKFLEEHPVMYVDGKPKEFGKRELAEIYRTGRIPFCAGLTGPVSAYIAKGEVDVLDIDKWREASLEDYFYPYPANKRKMFGIPFPGFAIFGTRESFRIPPTHAMAVGQFFPTIDALMQYASLGNAGHGWGDKTPYGTRIAMEISPFRSPVGLQDGMPCGNVCIYEMSKPPKGNYETVRTTENGEDLRSLMPLKSREE